jgi:predicted nucleic acid-binding protein
VSFSVVCGWLVERLWESRNGCLSVQVRQEFFVKVTQKIAKPLDAETAQEIIADLSRWYLHVPAADDVLAAIGIHQRTGISFWDAMIVRSAAEIGCVVLHSKASTLARKTPESVWRIRSSHATTVTSDSLLASHRGSSLTGHVASDRAPGLAKRTT